MVLYPYANLSLRLVQNKGPPSLSPSLPTFTRHNCTQSSRPIEVGIVQDEKAAVKSAQLGRDKRAKDALRPHPRHSQPLGSKRCSNRIEPRNALIWYVHVHLGKISMQDIL